MTRTGSHGVGPGAGSAPGGPAAGARCGGERRGAVIATAAALGMSGGHGGHGRSSPHHLRAVQRKTRWRASIFFAPGDSILSLVSGCVYRLNSALPDVRRNITIQGNHDTIRRNSGTYHRARGR